MYADYHKLNQRSVRHQWNSNCTHRLYESHGPTSRINLPFYCDLNPMNNQPVSKLVPAKPARNMSELLCSQPFVVTVNKGDNSKFFLELCSWKTEGQRLFLMIPLQNLHLMNKNIKPNSKVAACSGLPVSKTESDIKELRTIQTYWALASIIASS